MTSKLLQTFTQPDTLPQLSGKRGRRWGGQGRRSERMRRKMKRNTKQTRLICSGIVFLLEGCPTNGDLSSTSSRARPHHRLLWKSRISCQSIMSLCTPIGFLVTSFQPGRTTLVKPPVILPEAFRTGSLRGSVHTNADFCSFCSSDSRMTYDVVSFAMASAKLHWFVLIFDIFLCIFDWRHVRGNYKGSFFLVAFLQETSLAQSLYCNWHYAFFFVFFFFLCIFFFVVCVIFFFVVLSTCLLLLLFSSDSDDAFSRRGGLETGTYATSKKHAQKAWEGRDLSAAASSCSSSSDSHLSSLSSAASCCLSLLLGFLLLRRFLLLLLLLRLLYKFSFGFSCRGALVSPMGGLRERSLGSSWLKSGAEIRFLFPLGSFRDWNSSVHVLGFQAVRRRQILSKVWS